MGTISIRKGRHNQATIRVRAHIVQRPFCMVKAKALRRGNRLDEFPCAISNQQTFMGSIAFPHKFSTRLTAKIEESHTFGAIRRKRHIASLFAIVPDGIARIRKRSPCRCHTSTQQARSGHSKLIIIRNSAMVSTIKKFLRRTKSAIAVRHHPCALGLELAIIFVIPGIGHIDNRRIAIFEHAPTRNRDVSIDLDFQGLCVTCRKRTDIRLGLSRNAFHTSAENHKPSIR